MNWWEKIKEIYAGLFLLIAVGWVLAHLILIKLRGGTVTIKEDNKWILRAEIVLTSLIMFLGIERLIKDFKKDDI